jgi:hypothetical protein
VSFANRWALRGIQMPDRTMEDYYREQGISPPPVTLTPKVKASRKYPKRIRRPTFSHALLPPNFIGRPIAIRVRSTG